MGKKAVFRLFYTFSIAGTIVLALLTLLGWYAQYVSPDSFSLAPFVGLVLPALLVVNLCAAFYWLIRWRYWVFIPLLAIAANWDYIKSIYQYGGPEETSKENSFKVATYNVDSFGKDSSGEKCNEVAQFLKDEKADILCFQEFMLTKEFPLDSVLTVFSEWEYCAVPRSSKPLLQLAILSRYPIINSKLIEYEETSNCSMWCDVVINTDTIRVFNNHLQTTDVSRNKRQLEKEATNNKFASTHTVARLFTAMHDNFILRADQAEKVKEHTLKSPYPVIVCGDFNSLPSSYTYRTIRGKELHDGFHTAGKGYMYTYRFIRKILRIDYIFHAENFLGIDYYSPNVDHSDHKPVFMEMKIR